MAEAPRAAEADDKLIMEEIVVTATKTEKGVAEAPASVSVIQGDTIDAGPNATFDQALRYTPSIQIIRGEGIATVHNFINIRGIGEKRNLLYIDGVNMVESMSGNINLSFLPTEGIDQVEILRGPSSALYGGRGMSGVISIMTLDPDPGLHGSLSAAFGNYDFRKYQGSASYGGENLSLSLTLSDAATDNYWFRDTLIRRDYDYRTGIFTYDYDSEYETEGHEGWENWNRDYDERALRSKIRYAPAENVDMSFVFGIMDNETGNGFTDRYTDADGSAVEEYLEKDKAYAGLTGSFRLPGQSQLSYRLTYHNPESRIITENMDLTLALDDPAQLARSGRAPQFYRSESIQGSDDYEAELRWLAPVSHPLLGDHDVTLGVEYLRNEIYWSIEEKDTGRQLTPSVNGTKDAWSIYIQDEFFINDQFTLTAGLRGDFYDDFNDQVSPKLSLLYQHDSTTQFFASGGYAYNPPPYSQKFGTDWNMTAYTIRTNNPDLDAEKLKSAEVGMRKTIAEKFQASLTAYYAKADDLIESVKEKRQIGGPDSRVFMTYEYHDNIDEATMKGIESAFKFDVHPNHSLSGGVTYMDAENDETGQRLERSPNWLGHIAYRYDQQFDFFRIWSTIRGRGQDDILLGEYSVDEPRNVSGFFVFDMSLGVDIGPHVSLFANGTNLFDKDYREFTYTRYQPGRAWWIGGEIRF